MKRLLLNLMFLFVLANTFAQTQKFSATAAYPYALGEFEYAGQVVIGLQYRFVQLGPIDLGLSGNINFLKDRNELAAELRRTNKFAVQPRIFGELNLIGLEKLRPFLGLGYSFGDFATEFGQIENKDKEGGLNLNLGAAYYLSRVFFIHVQLDNIWLRREFSSLDLREINTIKRTSTISLLKVGLGFRF